MKRKIIKIGFQIIFIILFIRVTTGMFQDKFLDVKYSYNNLSLISGTMKSLNSGEYELNLILENNASEEMRMYDYYINLYTDSKLKNEIYYESDMDKEIVIPGGSTGRAIINIKTEEDIQVSDIYVKIDYLNNNRNIKVDIIKK